MKLPYVTKRYEGYPTMIEALTDSFDAVVINLKDLPNDYVQ